MTPTPQTKVFRGRALPEVIETVRRELGPDAIVMRQRTGLAGGVGGFFQKQFVEVEAVAGPAVDTPPEIDVVVGDTDEEQAFERLLAEAAAKMDRLVDDEQDKVDTTFDVPPVVADVDQHPDPEGPVDIAACELALAESGLDRDLAEIIMDDALNHRLPFSAGDVRRAVRRSLAAHISTVVSPSCEDRRIAIIGQAGSGRTTLARSIAIAYAEDGSLPVTLVTLGYDEPQGDPIDGVEHVSAPTVPELAVALADHSGVVIVDTPAMAVGWAEDSVQVAADLVDLGITELHLALPATMSAVAANEMLGSLGLVQPTALAVTFTDRTRHLGTALGVAIDTGVAVSFLASAGGVSAPDAGELAEAMLP